MRNPSASGDILVLGEVRSGRLHRVTLELTSKARSLADVLGGEVSTLLMYDRIDRDPRTIVHYGADRVTCVRDERLRLFDQEVQSTILSFVIGSTGPGIVLAPATTSGRTIMPAEISKFQTRRTVEFKMIISRRWLSFSGNQFQTNVHKGNYVQSPYR